MISIPLLGLARLNIGRDIQPRSWCISLTVLPYRSRPDVITARGSIFMVFTLPFFGASWHPRKAPE
jgi:hypothetical protein